MLINGAHVQLKDLGILQRETSDPTWLSFEDKVVLNIPKKPILISAKELARKLSNQLSRRIRVEGKGIWLIPIYSKFLPQELEIHIVNELKKLYPSFSRKKYHLFLSEINSEELTFPLGEEIKVKAVIPVGKLVRSKVVRFQMFLEDGSLWRDFKVKVRILKK